MTDISLLVTKWRESLTRGKDFDTWGQFVEASEEYRRLSQQISKYLAPEVKVFNVEQKKLLSKIAACLHVRSQFLQNLQAEEISLDDVRQMYFVLGNILRVENEDVPITLPNISGQILQTNSDSLTLEDISHDDAKEYGGTLQPRIPPEADCRRLTIKVVKIGVKDPSEFIDPFITVSIKGLDGVDITSPQNTPTAKSKENRNIHFDCDVELQVAIEKLPEGAAIFYEFKHFKPKKKRISTKCWTFMELDEIKPGAGCLELYDKPTNYCRKKLSLLTVKPLYLHVFLVIHDDEE